MTNHWRDIKNADLILINGANPAEAHPVGFQWFVRAKLDPKRGPGAGGGAKLVHADPRFTRTSALADIYARIRVGTDVAYFGALINYVLQHNLIHREYVTHYTNASFIVKEGYAFHDGLFNSYDASKRAYDPTTWAYETDEAATAAAKQVEAQAVAAGQAPGPRINIARRDMALQHPRCVYQLLKQHYSRYTPEMQATITGIPTEQFLEIAKLVGEIGRPGGGMNAERGHANIQGNTDHAISWDILPGYLRIPAPGQKTLTDYVTQ